MQHVWMVAEYLKLMNVHGALGLDVDNVGPDGETVYESHLCSST